MHDPMVVAFEFRRPWGKDKYGYSPTWLTIWHNDPEKDGTDDSCGWFIRPRHCDQKKLALVERRFEEDFDRTWTSDSGHVYECGLFRKDGSPNLPILAIALNLFFMACMVHYDNDWKKSRRWMNKHLFEVMHFAANPTDSLYDGFVRKFEKACNEPYTARNRSERIHSLAGCIYSYIMRAERPWYRHPRWHFRHWSIQFNLIQPYWRWLTARCAGCGKRFAPSQRAVSNWDGDKLWHDDCYPTKPCECKNG